MYFCTAAATAALASADTSAPVVSTSPTVKSKAFSSQTNCSKSRGNPLTYSTFFLPSSYESLAALIGAVKVNSPPSASLAVPVTFMFCVDAPKSSLLS